jgi:hypothetical protein
MKLTPLKCLAGCLAVYQSDLVPSLGYTLKVEMKVTLHKNELQEFSMMLKAIKEMELCIHYVCYC